MATIAHDFVRGLLTIYKPALGICVPAFFSQTSSSADNRNHRAIKVEDEANQVNDPIDKYAVQVEVLKAKLQGMVSSLYINSDSKVDIQVWCSGLTRY